MKLRIKILIASLGCLIIAMLPSSVMAQVLKPTPAPDFSFDNFAGTYYLDRDSKGVAKLSVQEDMTVVFPTNSNFYGIKRSIPKTYQGHDLGLKIISLTDMAGTPVQFKAYADGQGNEIVETGDKDITLTGLQTYKLNYQTSGVAVINKNSDAFLVNVNGRGWQETFGSVKAFIHVAKSFAANQATKSTCYIGFQDKATNACSVETQKETDGTLLITAASTQRLSGHQALVVNLDFKLGTFNQKKAASLNKLMITAIIAIVALALFLLLVARRRKPAIKG